MNASPVTAKEDSSAVLACYYNSKRCFTHCYGITCYVNGVSIPSVESNVLIYLLYWSERDSLAKGEDPVLATQSYRL